MYPSQLLAEVVEARYAARLAEAERRRMLARAAHAGVRRWRLALTGARHAGR